MFKHLTRSSNFKKVALLNGSKGSTSSANSDIHSSSTMNDRFEINSEEEFREKVMDSSIPVIVNFHAEWCEPCHSLRPLLEKIVKENQGKIHLAEVSSRPFILH